MRRANIEHKKKVEPKRSRRGRKSRIQCLQEYDPYLEAQERRIREHQKRVQEAKKTGLW